MSIYVSFGESLYDDSWSSTQPEGKYTEYKGNNYKINSEYKDTPYRGIYYSLWIDDQLVAVNLKRK